MKRNIYLVTAIFTTLFLGSLNAMADFSQAAENGFIGYTTRNKICAIGYGEIAARQKLFKKALTETELLTLLQFPNSGLTTIPRELTESKDLEILDLRGNDFSEQEAQDNLIMIVITLEKLTTLQVKSCNLSAETITTLLEIQQQRPHLRIDITIDITADESNECCVVS